MKTEEELSASNLFDLPLSCEYEEHGGYDSMSSAYWINDNRGKLVCVIDVKDIEPDRENCHYGESDKARKIAEWIVACANRRTVLPRRPPTCA